LYVFVKILVDICNVNVMEEVGNPLIALAAGGESVIGQ
jgi:hypothetical protein